MRVILILVAALFLANCAADGSEKVLAVDSANQSQARSVLLDLYRMIHCAHCETDFQRVAVPDSYDLPTEDLGTCFEYVLDHNPDNLNLLLSAWMECVETAPEELNR